MPENIVKKKILAQTIKNAAMNQGKSISTVEAFAGYSPGTFSRWISSENDEFGVLTKICAVADCLQMPLDELLGRFSAQPTGEKNSDKSPISVLCGATASNKVLWNKQTEKNIWALITKKFPTSEAGRSLCDIWDTSIDGVAFYLVLYSDDFDDSEESIDFSLLCSVGHGLPPYKIDVEEIDILQQIYTLLRAQQALTSLIPSTANRQLSQPENMVNFSKVTGI